ncbi:sugar kinase [Pelagibacterium luteolum]|uniref:2-dehydro-3-deoxygluconokinase n=1 Tax=Pelagibacterium luteolum TaxID=440168 RepID=A0A1G7XNX0_9HYPH|nr:sugar kinase [Pelagibacterium luteolum]SDG85887.1 2-dehydro-3-deoxygluconokinase [Pelagibacterium luteolum]
MTKRAVSIGEAMIEMSGGNERNYRLGFAGDTLNTAYYLRALLGADWTVDYITALGDDDYSRQMSAFIAGTGIGTSHIRTIPGKRPGLYMIHQHDGDRHFTYWRDSSAAKLLADDEDALTAAIADADLIYFSGITLAILAPAARETLLTVIAARRDAGAAVAFDPNIRPALWPGRETVAEALSAAARVATFVLPTHGDEVPYFGDADDGVTARRYRDAGAREAIVKNGADPALVVTADGEWRVSAQKVANVVDATGAGDSFNAGYLAARLAGQAPEAAAKAGHATASVVIGHHGALVPREKLTSL